MDLKTKLKNTGFYKIISPAYNLIKRSFHHDSHGTFIFYKPLNIVYIGIPKNANSSINRLFLKKLGIPFDENDYNTIHVVKQQFAISKKEVVKLKKSQSIKSIAFVRNPFSRLVSCYKNKIIDENSRPLYEGYYGFIYHKMSFEKFVNRIILIPDIMSDIHFRSQSSFLFKGSTPLFDYLGHVETLQEDCETIIKEHNLPPLKSINVSKKDYEWEEFYTPKLAEKVYKRYQKDFERLGYNNQLNRLL
jgi:hypothetical protein